METGKCPTSERKTCGVVAKKRVFSDETKSLIVFIVVLMRSVVAVAVACSEQQLPDATAAVAAGKN